MFFYFGVSLISAFLMYYIQYRQKRIWVAEEGIYRITRKKYIYMIPFLPLLLVSALRYGIGTDYFYTYAPAFYRIKNGIPLNHSMESGYILVNKIVARFSDDVTWVIVFCAILFFVFLGKAIVEQSENPALSILLVVGTGLFGFSMNGMRQAIVIAVWMYSIKFIKQKKFKPYLFYLLIASFFHVSALIMIPFYVIYQYQITPKVAILSVIGTVVFSTFFRKIILYAASFTKYYDKFIGTSQVEGNFTYSTFAVLIVIFIYLLLLYKPLKKVWEYNFLLLSTTIGVVLAVLTKDIYVVARLLSFFQYMPTLYFAVTERVFTRESQKVVSLLAIIFFFTYTWFMADYLGKGEIVPYISIFSR